MKLPRFGAAVLAMALALPAWAQSQTPPAMQKGSPPPSASTSNRSACCPKLVHHSGQAS